MRKFKMELDMENQAFDFDWRLEVARILDDVIAQLHLAARNSMSSPSRCDGGLLRDRNGSTVGRWSGIVSEDAAADPLPDQREVEIQIPETIEMEEYQLAGSRAFRLDDIDSHVPADLRFNVRLEKEARLLLLQLRSHIVSSKGEEYTLTAPVTWWDHFKLERFPMWALRRWPARVRVEKVTFRNLLPTIKLGNRRHESITHMDVATEVNRVP